jgi:sulfate adenylyltransferase
MTTSSPAGAEPAQTLVVDGERAEVLKKIARDLPDITLTERQSCDLELLANGALAPLKGYMVRSDYESVLDRMRLQDGTLWPLPVCLDVPELKARSLEAGQSVALRDLEGFLLAVMHVEDIWAMDRAKEAQQLFGTTERDHPGVKQLYEGTADYYLGGALEVVSLPLHFDFQQLRRTPEEVRDSFAKLGWRRIVGFQSKQPVHRFQFEITLKAMRQAKANLLLMPAVGVTHPGDFDYYTRVRCFREVARRYPPDAMQTNLLPLVDRAAGPRNALLHCIIAKNYGCTHFIVGHGHGTPVRSDNGEPWYEPDASQQITQGISDELGLEVMPFKEMVYLPFEDEYRFVDDVDGQSHKVSLSGRDIRERIRTGRQVPSWATFPEVLTELRRSYPPPRQQGLTVFFTGLSGAGKSTLAKILYCRFLELGDRPVTLLDGDIVRQNLSSELSFSKEHRDINVRRIGFVASEITKNRGIAICAPIAPYESTRNEIREAIEAYGGFIEVHVATPIGECQKRDRKGMYAKAFAGLIKGFTGVDDPYEEPQTPELRIDTTGRRPNECAKEILLLLGEKGYL